MINRTFPKFADGPQIYMGAEQPTGGLSATHDPIGAYASTQPNITPAAPHPLQPLLNVYDRVSPYVSDLRDRIPNVKDYISPETAGLASYAAPIGSAFGGLTTQPYKSMGRLAGGLAGSHILGGHLAHALGIDTGYGQALGALGGMGLGHLMAPRIRRDDDEEDDYRNLGGYAARRGD